MKKNFYSKKERIDFSNIRFNLTFEVMEIHSAKREQTSERIIAAAGVVFAEHGFRATTIRQITSRAGVNLAAVNYHFRDKGELYVRVLREAKRCVESVAIKDISGTPEERLEEFIVRFVGYLLDPERPSWHGRVLSMEISNPTPALGILIREVTGPFFRDVRTLISEVVNGKASSVELDLFALSVFSQCVFYASHRSIVEQLALDLDQVPDRIKRIAAHISAVSLVGLNEFRQRLRRKSPRASSSRTPKLALR